MFRHLGFFLVAFVNVKAVAEGHGLSLFDRVITSALGFLLKIEEDDFKSKGNWSETEVFFNISYAVLEMSCDKIRFIN